MTTETKHISVCVCTYKRPESLKRLLGELANQETEGRFTFSIVVADNDGLRSAEALLSDFAVGAPTSVTYCVEPQQNISLTRNHSYSLVESHTNIYMGTNDRQSCRSAPAQPLQQCYAMKG